MLKVIRENVELVKQNIINKNESASVDEIISLDVRRREIITEVDKLKNIRNVVSKEIAMLKKNKEDADNKISEMKQVSESIKSMDEELSGLQAKIDELVLYIPNIAHESVPVGNSENDNKQIRTWGEALTPSFAKDHMTIAKEYGLVDFERGAKVSGSGFAYYTDKGATLERALINYFIDFNKKNGGFKELFMPFIVGKDAMTGTGQLPKMAEDMYHAEADDMYLIPTAEVPITNFHAKEILPVNELPIKYCGYSPCFRREAGSYGKETRGLLRVHQFNKVELVKFTKPEDSYNELESLVGNVEALLQSLNLPYRVLLLCSGDTSFASAMTYDLEVWSPGEEKWLEVSSCSNFESFQAMRAGIRFKRDPKSKPEFVHTLNGSGLATPRIMVALLENNLKEDGTIEIPEVLRSYCGFNIINNI
jgi:seryl-tRNA synthetase